MTFDKPAKKLKKGTTDILETSVIGGAGSLALGSIGGAAATSGQAGIAGATRFLGTTGTVLGAGAVVGLAGEAFKQPKKRKSRRNRGGIF